MRTVPADPLRVLVAIRARPQTPFGFGWATDFAYVVNMDVTRKLDGYPPFEFLQVAEVVGN